MDAGTGSTVQIGFGKYIRKSCLSFKTDCCFTTGSYVQMASRNGKLYLSNSVGIGISVDIASKFLNFGPLDIFSTSLTN
jgi:hypothetical protein